MPRFDVSGVPAPASAASGFLLSPSSRPLVSCSLFLSPIRLVAASGCAFARDVAWRGPPAFRSDPTAFARASATRQNSASQSLSSTTQLTWFLGGGPLVSQRSERDVLKRTCLVEPVGL